MLDPVEETVDEVAFFVERPVDRLARGSCRVPRESRCRAKLAGDEIARMVGVISRIRHDAPDAGKSFDQASRLRAVSPLDP